MPTSLSDSSARGLRRLRRDVVVQHHRLDELLADRVHRVQRRHRVLEDHRHLVAADRAAAGRGHADQVVALEQRLAAEIVFLVLFRPMIVRQVTLLPQPDSPTMPSVFPFSTEKLTPSTALTTPSSVRKWSAGPVRRAGPSGESDPRIDPGVQQVDDQVEDDDADASRRRPRRGSPAGRSSRS